MEKGLLLCTVEPKFSENEEEYQPPEGLPGQSAKDKGIPNLSGRTDFNFNRN